MSFRVGVFSIKMSSFSMDSGHMLPLCLDSLKNKGLVTAGLMLLVAFLVMLIDLIVMFRVLEFLSGSLNLGGIVVEYPIFFSLALVLEPKASKLSSSGAIDS